MQPVLAQTETLSNNVLRGHFPTQRHNSAPLPRDRMTFSEVAVALVLDTHARNDAIIKKLRVLANPKYANAMPLPINPRIVNGKLKSGPDSICAASIWSRRQFEAWRTGRHPDSAMDRFDTQNSAQLLAQGAARLAGGEA